MPDADAVQIRAIAQTLFDTWKANHEAEQQADRKHKLLLAQLPAWIACALSIGGVVLLAGGTNERINNNERRIDNLEISDREQDRDVRGLSNQLAAIDAKLTIIVKGR
jgi:hypothetical protein